MYWLQLKQFGPNVKFLQVFGQSALAIAFMTGFDLFNEAQVTEGPKRDGVTVPAG